MPIFYFRLLSQLSLIVNSNNLAILPITFVTKQPTMKFISIIFALGLLLCGIARVSAEHTPVPVNSANPASEPATNPVTSPPSAANPTAPASPPTPAPRPAAARPANSTPAPVPVPVRVPSPGEFRPPRLTTRKRTFDMFMPESLRAPTKKTPRTDNIIQDIVDIVEAGLTNKDGSPNAALLHALVGTELQEPALEQFMEDQCNHAMGEACTEADNQREQYGLELKALMKKYSHLPAARMDALLQSMTAETRGICQRQFDNDETTYKRLLRKFFETFGMPPDACGDAVRRNLHDHDNGPSGMGDDGGLAA